MFSIHQIKLLLDWLCTSDFCLIDVCLVHSSLGLKWNRFVYTYYICLSIGLTVLWVEITWTFQEPHMQCPTSAVVEMKTHFQWVNYNI